MSKSPKSLSTLASSLQLSSISRVTARSSAGNHVAKYILRNQSGACVVVRHRRHASTSTSSAASSAASAPGHPAAASSSSSASLGSSPSSASAPASNHNPSSLASTSSSVARPTASTSSSSGSTLLRRTASLNGSSGSKVAYFHSNARAANQQPTIPSSSSSSSPLTPPPSSPSGHAHSHSSHSKPPNTPGLPTTDPSTLLLSPHHHVPASGSSLASDGSSSSAGYTSSNVSSTSGPSAASSGAALFSSDRAHSFPQHSLPSFFGTSLSIARRSNLVFRNGAYGIPKAGPNTAAKGKEKAVSELEAGELDHYLSIGIGEDAYFLRTDSLGVADGVGGWSGHAGANPARWSRKLMHHCSYELARYENVEDELFLRYYEVDPVEVLQRAFEKSLAECKDEGVIGSSTALLAVLRNDELRLANMGDCCCSIIRGNDYIFRSEEQQHSFNFPVQAGTNSKDTPIKDAQRFNIKVQKDDIVILSSDGLMDNLYDEDILEEVLRFVASSPPPPQSSSAAGPAGAGSGPRYTLNKFSPQAVSEALSLRAKSVYEDPRAVSSPFQQRAVEEGIHFVGGKRDDITTLIGVVGELEASPDRR